MDQRILQFENLVKRYGPVTALDGISLDVTQNRVVALLGPNGAGKSTLFGCLLGLVRASSGTILFNGSELSSVSRQRFGYVCERVALYPNRTVWENGIFFSRLAQRQPHELEAQLKRVGLYTVRDRKVRHLSKGMLQRLGLAIGLCGEPDLLVLDEPFNGLDPVVLESLQRILREEHERGATMLIATHTISAVEELATHLAILLDGRIVESRSLEEIRDTYGTESSLESIYHRIARRQRDYETAGGVSC